MLQNVRKKGVRMLRQAWGQCPGKQSAYVDGTRGHASNMSYIHSHLETRKNSTRFGTSLTTCVPRTKVAKACGMPREWHWSSWNRRKESQWTFSANEYVMSSASASVIPRYKKSLKLKYGLTNSKIIESLRFTQRCWRQPCSRHRQSWGTSSDAHT